MNELGEWSDWMGVAEVCEDLDSDPRTVSLAARGIKHRTVGGFEVVREERGRSAGDRARFKYRYRYVGSRRPEGAQAVEATP